MKSSVNDPVVPAETRELKVGSLSYTPRELAVTISWILLGAFAWSFRGRAGQPIAQLLLGDAGESDDTISALIGSVPGALTLVLLPFVGWLSDHFRSPWGRRIPFLALAIPFVAVASAGLAISPTVGNYLERTLDWHPFGNANTVVLLLATFWGLFAFADIIGNLIFGALINDVIPAQILGRVFGAFRAATLLAGVLFNYFFFGRIETDYVPILMGIGLCVILALGFMCVRVREGEYPSLPSHFAGWSGIRHDVREYGKECFESPVYLLLYIAWGLGVTAWSSVNFYSVLFTTGFISSGHYVDLLTVTYSVSLVMAYPIGILADRFHPLRLGIVTLAIYVAASLWGGCFATTPSSFDIAFILHGVLSGAYLTATASLLQRLLPRLKFAMFAAAAGMTVCFFNIIIAPLAGFVLDAAHRDYRSIFLLSSAQSFLALIATIVLYRAVRARGGIL